LCQVYRAGGPVFAGDLERYVPGRGDYADFCVDRNGLVVEEAWVLKRKLIQRRAAVELEIEPAIDRRLFDIDIPEQEGIARGLVQRLPSDEVRGLWAFTETPKGFEKLGRFGVVIPEAALPNVGAMVAGAGPSSTTDVYVRGPDLLVVDQDPSLVALIQRESRPTRDVEVPGLNDAKLIADARMSEIRARTPDGSVVRIFGTIPPSELLDLARLLQVTE
jgi:hypothetical protein